MRIKKSAILEAVANTNTSNTTTTNTSIKTGNQNSNTNNLPKPEDIKKSEKALDNLKSEVGEINKEVENGPMGAFLKLSENDYPGGEDYEKQQDFLNDLNNLDESIKSKRKVIKTIKVKDLK
jgi:hypothetical protein